MGCDLPLYVSFGLSFDVSIHAPTWGATECVQARRTKRYVSIHAPTWGATVLKILLTFICLFQSTHPHGVRQKYRPLHLRRMHSFNPRTHMGCDLPRVYRYRQDYQMFQSTHPHGVRQYVMLIVPHSSKFQSTHPHGVRRLEGCNLTWQILFQSTHPHGVRRLYIFLNLSPKCFNPRTHMGCDFGQQSNFHD